MTHEEFNTLQPGDMVTAKSGKVYRVYHVVTLERKRAMWARKQAGENCCWYPESEMVHNTVVFIGQRNGRDFGPLRGLKAENITKS